MNAQFKKFRPASLTVTGRFQQALELCTQLRQEVQAELVTAHDFRSLELAVEAVPIAANEYAWLRTRLHNAKAYVNGRETHAAAYELVLFANRLRSRLNAGDHQAV